MHSDTDKTLQLQWLHHDLVQGSTKTKKNNYRVTHLVE